MLSRRVLGFVENHERVVEGAASHERERSDFNISPLNETIGSFHVHHIEQRIVQRAKIRIHLRVHVPRQITEFFARFDCRPREDNAADILLHQRTHRHSHRQIGLTCAGRTNPDDDVMLFDRVEVVFLGRSLGYDEALPSDDGGRAEEQFLEGGVVIVAEGGQCVSDVI